MILNKYFHMKMNLKTSEVRTELLKIIQIMKQRENTYGISQGFQIEYLEDGSMNEIQYLKERLWETQDV